MINLGVIGLGHWGPNHVRVFDSMPNVRVAYAIDERPKRVDLVKEIYPHVGFDRDAEALIHDEAIDAVVIATPATTHIALVEAAIRAGKHVLCEKPLGVTSSDAMRVHHFAESKEVLLMVGFVFLFNPGIVTVKRLVQDGTLGDVRYATAKRTNLGPIRYDIDAIMDLASHDISIFNWVFDAVPEYVSATGACFLRDSIEDVGFLSLRYPNGVLANIHVSWLDPMKIRQATIVGERKMVTWDDLAQGTPVSVYDKGAKVTRDYGDYGEFLKLSVWEGNVDTPEVAFQEPLRLQAEAFISSIGRLAVDRGQASFAAEVLSVLEAAEVSATAHGAPVHVDSP